MYIDNYFEFILYPNTFQLFAPISLWIHACLSFEIKICFGYQIVFKSSYWSVQNRFNKCWSTCICIINKQNEERQVCRVLIHCVPTVIQGTTGKPLLVKIGQIQIFYTGDCSDKDRASATVKCVPIVRINGQLVIRAKMNIWFISIRNSSA